MTEKEKTGAVALVKRWLLGAVNDDVLPVAVVGLKCPPGAPAVHVYYEDTQGADGQIATILEDAARAIRAGDGRAMHGG